MARAPLSLKARAIGLLAQREHSRAELRRKLLRIEQQRVRRAAALLAPGGSCDGGDGQPAPDCEAEGDTEGDEALTRAVRAARERGAIVVIVAHRPIGIEEVDQLLVLRDGRMQAFGPKETVLGQVLQRVTPPPPIKIVSDAGVAKS